MNNKTDRTVGSSLCLATLLLLALGCAIYFWMQSRPHLFPDAPSGEFACLSYTMNDDAIEDGLDIRTRIERDLKQLSERTRCVRTYSVLNGLDYVPVAARKFNMRVLLGIWIGTNSATNEQELALGIRTANENRDVIDAVIVGNEVLLRREQTADVMATFLQRVHDATQLPVTYADVWDFWLKNPQLANASDFVTIHILPYWDDIPIDIDHAMQHVGEIFDKVQAAFPGRRIFVGEVGWPSEGRQREAAKPSLLNQARFTRDFIAFASTHNIPYNFIEAFDQPWKKGLEGTVGGYWGLYDAAGHAKFPLTGPVVADAQWWRGPLGGVIAAAMFWLWSLKRKQSLAAQLRWLLVGACLGQLVVVQWHYLWISNRNWQEWLGMGALTILSAGIALLEALPDKARAARWRGGLWLVLLLMLAYMNMGLSFEWRYRDFPSAFIVLPVVLSLYDQIHLPTRFRDAIELLTLWLVLSPIIIAWHEKLTNLSALWWCVLCLATGLRLLWLLWATRLNQEQRAQ